MNSKTIKAMVKEAYDSGIAVIHYAGTNSGGLASSYDNWLRLFLNRYPDMTHENDPQGRYKEMLDGLKAGNEKFDIKNYFDSIEVKEGYLKVTVNHLIRQDKSNHTCESNDDLVAADEYRSRYTANFVEAIKYDYSVCNYSTEHGERLHTVLIPFENVLYINVK